MSVNWSCMSNVMILLQSRFQFVVIVCAKVLLLFAFNGLFIINMIMCCLSFSFTCEESGPCVTRGCMYLALVQCYFLPGLLLPLNHNLGKPNLITFSSIIMIHAYSIISCNLSILVLTKHPH